MALPLPCVVLLSALTATLDWGSGDWGSGEILETGWGSGEFGSGVVEGDSPPSPPLAVAEYRWFCKEDSGKSSHYPTCDSVCAGGEAICCSYPARSSSHPSGMRCLASTTGSNINPVTQLPYWVDDALCGAIPPRCVAPSPPSPPFSPPSPPLAVAEYRWFCKEDSGKSSHYPTCDSVCAGGEAICCSYPARSSSHPSGMRCLASTTGSNINPVTQLPYWVDDALCGARPLLCDSPVVGPTRGLSQLSYYYQLPAKPVLEIDVGIPSDEALSYMVRQISDGDCYMITDRLAPRWPGFGLGGVDCFTMITSIQGDGHCDRILNTAFYHFDGGDCDVTPCRGSPTRKTLLATTLG